MTQTKAAKRFPFELIREDLEKVESEIREQASAFDPAVEGYVAYVCNTSGKRIRPALAILAGGAVGGCGEENRKLGVILELIHIASLVHDDIMDGADVRRGMPTAAAKWGNSLSVLLGDALFAHALELATEFDDNEVCRAISRAARDVCSGEILQTQRRFDLTLDVSTYYRIIEMKTAALFEAATCLGARVSGASESVQEALGAFGLKLGTAYQIYDDCVDLVGSEDSVGKTLGTDLAKGKLTLPLLNLIAGATEVQKGKLNRLLLQHEPVETSALANIADYEGAIESATDEALTLVGSARENLMVLSGSDYSEALDQVAGYLEGLLLGCKG